MGARGLHNWFLSLLAAVILFTGWAALLLSSAAAYAEKRVALVVGIDRYPNLGPDRQLLKAVNDAKAVGDALAKIGFSVIRGANLGRQGMIDQLDELTSQLEPGDTAAFFYAGHGVAIGGNNYLIPSDVPSVTPDAEARVRGASIAETDVVAELQARGVRVALLVLDACRDNPFPRSATRAIGNTRGLLDAKAARGVFTIYSAGIGQAALDRLEPNDPSRNSVFTRVFIDELTKPDLDLAGLAIEVREKVAALARQAKGESGQPEPHEQTPAYYDQTIGGRIFLAGRSISVEAAPVAPPVPAAQPAIAPAAQAWAVTKDTNSQAVLEDFIRQFGPTVYGSMARARLEELKKGQVAVVAPPVLPPVNAPMVAQRIVLYEEDPNDQQGRRYVGSAIWRTETVSPGPGLAPELAVRADVEIPERRMTVTWSLRRNTDKALPASHTIEIMFNLPADFPGGGIANVPGILMKQTEQARGTPLAGLAVKVTNGSFLIGLSAVDTDMQSNLRLLKDRPWFDIPIVYTNGGRAILAMEKGPPGDRAFAEALAVWMPATKSELQVRRLQ